MWFRVTENRDKWHGMFSCAQNSGHYEKGLITGIRKGKLTFTVKGTGRNAL
eukprot:CAMPEP_0169480228 /NCGR_PEP_ID=MMETSP1042-20121227/29456_1 /TAXON_ID=464988 /ORGANISM="Hemiselmis andersenii, Strain CCMP1180" /LENGTH=50 /DNA_ID=CAMNT_0009594867 /DNA_START=32 /DNA_END=180 /DNA_ORIENTATION=+